MELCDNHFVFQCLLLNKALRQRSIMHGVFYVYDKTGRSAYPSQVSRCHLLPSRYHFRSIPIQTLLHYQSSQARSALVSCRYIYYGPYRDYIYAASAERSLRPNRAIARLTGSRESKHPASHTIMGLLRVDNARVHKLQRPCINYVRCRVLTTRVCNALSWTECGVHALGAYFPTFQYNKDYKASPAPPSSKFSFPSASSFTLFQVFAIRRNVSSQYFSLSHYGRLFVHPCAPPPLKPPSSSHIPYNPQAPRHSHSRLRHQTYRY